MKNNKFHLYQVKNLEVDILEFVYWALFVICIL